MRPDLIRQLVPSFAEGALRAQGIDIDGFVPIPLEQLRISLDVSGPIDRMMIVKADLFEQLLIYHVQTKPL